VEFENDYFRSKIVKNNKGFKEFLGIRSYGNLVVGLQKFSTERKDLLSIDGYYLYRVKSDIFEEYLNQSLSKSD